MRLDDLRSGDRRAVHRLLHDYLHWHITAWAASVGLDWSTERVDRHLRSHDLVEQDWAELEKASNDPEQFVAVLRDDGDRVVGIVFAQSRIDRFFEKPRGVLSWIAVDPAVRRRGAGKTLMTAARDWMLARGLDSAQLYVTAGNDAAIALYEATGFRIVDHRMLADLRED